MKRRSALQTPAVDRRTFVFASSAALVADPRALFAPRRPGPNEKVHVAHVGVGGMGGSDLGSVASSKWAEVIGLCDVDANRLGAAAKRLPKAKAFADWRVMLDELGDDLDAVVVSTPDHMHAPVALAAMRRGKHVYCQKPIAQDLRGCRRMAEAAEEFGVVSQMGTQIHSHGAYRTAVATLQSGVIGKVKEAHLWVSKSWAGPKDGRPDREDPVPEGLDWDLWLGVAPERPYAKGLYHPAAWRGWIDFGAGTLGDMGCHIFDPVFTALGLGAPDSVVSKGPAHGNGVFAADSDITYTYPGTEWTTEKLVMRWTDGNRGSRPDASRAQLPEGVKLPGAGSFLVGEKGVLVIPHWSTPQIYREGEKVEDALTVLENRNHYHEWVDACRGEDRATTPFSYSGPLTEAVLLGTLAGRFPDRQLSWDSAALRTGDEEVDALVERKWRAGFED